MTARVVNDVHSRLNRTLVADTVRPDSLAGVQAAIARARFAGKAVAIAGGRHSMGGQQFCSDAVLLDTRGLARVLAFDRVRGTVECEAGIQWPEIVRFLREAQPDELRPWTIRQKQTGANRLSLGGAVSANAHGRGLAMQPIAADVESLVMVDPAGIPRRCSREEEPELFRLVIGGYGLFGVVYSVTLRLAPRRTLERVVELCGVDAVVGRFQERIDAGFLYGDFQFAIDPDSHGFLHRGVLSCYRPVDDRTPVRPDRRALSAADWRTLVRLAHTDKSRAFDLYASHYLATSGQIYRSDEHQFAEYLDGYHAELDRVLGSRVPASEVITELYVPPERLPAFMDAAATELRRRGADVIYGTVRLIERDDETFLAWARERYACVVLNLHVDHTPDGIARAAQAFRALIDLAAERGGSFYLAYHRYATAEQVDRCYPQFRGFLRRKRACDPAGVFESDWYRHYASLFRERAKAAA